MRKYYGDRYNSAWDGSTWFVLMLVAACTVLILILDINIAPAIVAGAVFIFVLLVFVGTYYRIAGDQLIVYSFFIPKAYPIEKIKEIRPTKNVTSAPAASLSHRIQITFTERGILKSSTPLIISPVRQPDFIHQLLSINPDIKYIQE